MSAFNKKELEDLDDEHEDKREYDLNIIRATLSSNGYSFLRPIGQGGFSSVFLVFSTQYNIEFVVKVSDYKKAYKSNSKDSNGFDFTEINNLINLNHPNIISIYKYFTDDHYLYIILEYCHGGSLKDLIQQHGRVPTSNLFHYCHQILTALKHCHDLQITHNDIKPANVLIDKNQRLKLADFGLAKGISTEYDQVKGKNGEILLKHFGGSRPYMAPELFSMAACDPYKVDIWSLGVTFFELATGHIPWKTNDMEQMRLQISVGVFSFENLKLPPTFCKIIHRMLEVVPSKRPTVGWLLEQPIFNPETKSPLTGRCSSSGSLYQNINLCRSSFRTIERGPNFHLNERKRSLISFDREALKGLIFDNDSNVDHQPFVSNIECDNSNISEEANPNLKRVIESDIKSDKLDGDVCSPEKAEVDIQRVSIQLKVAPRQRNVNHDRRTRASLPIPKKTFV